MAITPNHQHIHQLTQSAGLHGKPQIFPLASGRNNRVYRLQIRHQSYLLKSYFSHPNDKRDRLAAEFLFCQFARKQDHCLTPTPLAADSHNKLGLYQFISGAKLSLENIEAEHIQQAWEFIVTLNRQRELAEKAAFSSASEACFSLNEHQQCVKRRLDALTQMKGNSTLDKQALSFVNQLLLPAFKAYVTTLHIPPNYVDNIERIISPSDFGFHNALQRPDGKLCFIDFEYSGWDDPAKLICDFFCQPQIPISLVYLTEFCNNIGILFDNQEALIQRVTMLMPLYRIKWCCILLNEFLPVDLSRRQFAQAPISENDRHRDINQETAIAKQRQLNKAEAYFTNHIKRH